MAPSDRREDSRLVAALVLLTLLTGLVDAASVLGLGHVFTANMTGNVVFLGFSLVGAGRVATSDCVVALAAFVAGAIIAGRLARPGVRFAFALALEAVLIGAAAIIAATAPRLAVEIALLAFAMGVQNASVRKLAVVDMTTTVLTLTLTGLAADSSLAGGINPRIARRLTSVAVMLVGAVTGALLLRRGVSWTIGAAALVAMSACAVASTSARRPPRES